MPAPDDAPTLLPPPAGPSADLGTVVLDRATFAERLEGLADGPDLPELRAGVEALQAELVASVVGGELAVELPATAVSFREDRLREELQQVREAHTLERARYYLRRLRKSVLEERVGAVNDLNLLRWKEYDEILTDSLWLLPRRDRSGAHVGWYWGNFVPQIPHQLMQRFTKKGDWVLDTFLGSGTTLIECRRLRRNGIGVELSPTVAEKARELIAQQPNEHGVVTEVVNADSRTLDLAEVLAAHGIRQVQLVIMHPPYHDIIRFSETEEDLSTAGSTEKFLGMFGEIVENAGRYLQKGRYLAVVIGDKFVQGEWIPLGFYCMNEVMRRGYQLKSIVVKNFDDTRAKRSQQELWRYRALAGGFYIFKHEYVLLFKKLR